LPNRKQYAFVDYHGKQALNFQISMALYALVVGMISFPFFLGILPNIFDGGIFEWTQHHHRGPFHFGLLDNLWDSPRFWWPLGLTGILELALYAINIIYTILATLRTSEGEYFKYPLTIPFIK
jgi:uncharacterized Tic20 family protein